MQSQQNICDHFDFSRAFCRISAAFSRSNRFLQIACQFIACIYSLFCCISCSWRISRLLGGTARRSQSVPIICITLLLCNTYNSLQSMPSPAFPAAAKENSPASGGFPPFLRFFRSNSVVLIRYFPLLFRQISSSIRQDIYILAKTILVLSYNLSIESLYSSCVKIVQVQSSCKSSGRSPHRRAAEAGSLPDGNITWKWGIAYESSQNRPAA